ncbi:YeiH family protein [Nocardia stercoris]|uniref:Putative sulfate exporter family transporter n=1 Tax=Nocardia stercoris TaxID=2483361 RepID=A0A3M2L5C6_9NOCA|nr:putative sulfate exporter family transporter [Nocardia stercoris]RMI32594.1 putative sulfate exporter family transporter [Nocardia stercoris]
MTRLEPLPATAPARPRPSPPRVTALLPGLAVTSIVVAVLMLVHHWLPQVSPLLLAIVVGAVVANIDTLPQRLQPGLQFSAKRVLRIGVALLGLQVTVGDIAGLGPGVLAVVVVIVAGGIAGTLWMGRLLGLSWTQRLLIACGFSICGAAAAAAVDGMIDAKDEELVTTVALVVVFGTLLIGLIPLLAGVFGLDARTGGIWAGGAVHEVAQVVAAGGAIGGGALTVAVLVKLARVVLLAPVLAVVGLRVRQQSRGRADAVAPPLVPLFVVAFLGFVVLRSTGTVPASVLGVAGVAQTALLTAAMFALGTGVRIAALRRVGPRPLVLAALSTVWVSAIALAGALLVG